MITAYGLLLKRCGLSLQEAAAFQRVTLDTIKSWSTGRTRAPADALAQLRELYARIECAAEATLDEIKAQRRAFSTYAVIELVLVNDGIEAEALGWPSVGVQAAMLGLVAVRLKQPVRIVRRGTSLFAQTATDTAASASERQ